MCDKSGRIIYSFVVFGLILPWSFHSKHLSTEVLWMDILCFDHAFYSAYNKLLLLLLISLLKTSYDKKSNLKRYFSIFCTFVTWEIFFLFKFSLMLVVSIFCYLNCQCFCDKVCLLLDSIFAIAPLGFHVYDKKACVEIHAGKS